MQKLAIIGAAELGSLVLHLAKETGKYTVVGFYDDRSKLGSFEGQPLLGKVSDIEKDFIDKKFDQLVVAVGYNHMAVRKKLFLDLSSSIPFATIIHPSAIVHHSSSVGSGSIIFPGCVIDQYANVGNNVLLNTAVTIAHHSNVGDHCFITPRVALAGRVTIGTSCFIGIGAIVKDEITIGDNCILGAGSLVLKSIEKNKLAYGSPAKVIKDNL
jgi:sugar O-acyltransferase (sialic acid O-acetyltransferase NeuD family)